MKGDRERRKGQKERKGKRERKAGRKQYTLGVALKSCLQLSVSAHVEVLRLANNGKHFLFKL